MDKVSSVRASERLRCGIGDVVRPGLSMALELEICRACCEKVVLGVGFSGGCSDGDGSDGD